MLAVLTSAWDRLHVELLEEDAEMALKPRLYVRGHVRLVGKHDARRGERCTSGKARELVASLRENDAKFSEQPLGGATCALGAAEMT